MLNDRLSVMGLNTSASSLQISDFVDEEGGEGEGEDDGNIFKGVGKKKAPNQSTLFDDDDDEDVYEYGAQGKYIQQINNSEQINAFTKKTSSGVLNEREAEEQQSTPSNLNKYGLGGEEEQGDLFANEGRQQKKEKKVRAGGRESL